MQLRIFLTIHINHISLIPDKSLNTVILWQWVVSVHCPFFEGVRGKSNLHHFKFTAFLWTSPHNLHMKQQSIYLFLHSVCQCGLWYHRVFVETPQLNLRVVIHRRQNCPDLWMKSILNCPGQLMHCQFYKEKNISFMQGYNGRGIHIHL